jgi:hypothetical protein
MRARVPLDVDLEDRIVFGLTPIRLGYVVLSGLGGLAAWSSQLPLPIRAVVSLLVLGFGVAVAWGRWNGRAADAWLLDLASFIVRTRQVTWSRR